MEDNKDKKPIKRPDYYYRVAREVKMRDPETKEYIRDRRGHIKTETVLGKPEGAYFNHSIDSYDIMVRGDYYATLHVPAGLSLRSALTKAREKYDYLLSVPIAMIELKFNMTIV